MKHFANRLEFEEAAKIRDRIHQLEQDTLKDSMMSESPLHRYVQQAPESPGVYQMFDHQGRDLCRQSEES